MDRDWLQMIIDPTSFQFFWTDDGWYTFDRQAAHKAAIAERRRRAKELKAQGYKVRLSTLSDQLISKGGIGSGRPHIELVVNCYMLYACR